MSNLNAKKYKKFEEIKYIIKDESKHWITGELAIMLDYSQWRNFQKIDDIAIIACKNCEDEITFDFTENRKIDI